MTNKFISGTLLLCMMCILCSCSRQNAEETDSPSTNVSMDRYMLTEEEPIDEDPVISDPIPQDENNYIKDSTDADVAFDTFGFPYIKNQIVFMTYLGTDKSIIEKLASDMDADIVGYIQSCCFYQIEFRSDKSFEELEELVEFIEGHSYIMYAGLNSVGEESHPNDTLYTEDQEAVFDLDSFYQNPVTQPYKDIRTLGESYDKEQAQTDMCFVIGAMVHNDNLYSEFMERYQNKEDTFIRVVQGTEKSGIMIDDILYDSSADKIYLVHDSTRDNLTAETDKSITLNEFEDITEYNYNGRLYWIAFNGKISDIDFDSDEVFVITLIN